MSKSPSFLVIQTAFIGDAILSTSLLEKIHDYFPDSSIDILVRKGNESIFENHPFLRKVHIWDKKKNKYGSLFSLLFDVRKKSYDYVINLQRFGSTGFLTTFSGAKETIGFDKNPFSAFFTHKISHNIKPGVHEIHRLQSLIEWLTGGNQYKPRIYPSESDFSKVEDYKVEKYITCAPASVWFTKQYPAESWINFMDRLPNNVQIYLIGGPGDKDLCMHIADKSIHEKTSVLCGKLNLLESAALMKDAEMNYVNDSAPMHLASAVNAPVTAIYCSTIPEFGFGPLSDTSFIVQGKEKLICRPCGLHGKKHCPEGHFRCALDIEADQLVNKYTS